MSGNLAFPITTSLMHPFVQRLADHQPQHIVFYGTSLTAGGAWVPQLLEVLGQRFPGLVTFHNGAGSGMNSRWGVENLGTNVIGNKPDVVFLEFSVNDSCARFELSLDECRRNLESMLDRIQTANPAFDVILQVMNPVIDRPEGHAGYRPNLSAYQDVYRDVAGKRGLLLIDHMPAWTQLLERDEATFRAYVPDGLHPAAPGYAAIVTPTILRAISLA